jgi:nitrogen regulatory protein P-II 2
MVETAKVRLVTLIAAFELEERLVKDLRALGVKGYMVGKVNGRGVHGTRMAGLSDAPDLRLEMLVAPALAEKILERVARRYVDQPIMGYVHDVQAVPGDLF